MAKLTYEDKKEIIRLFEQDERSEGYIARKFNVAKSSVQRIINKYRIHGEDILMKQKNRYYSPDEKLAVINRCFNGESKTSLAAELNISTGNICQWVKKYEKYGYNGLIDKPKGRPPTMKKEKKIIDPNDKDAIIKEKDQRILELEAEVEALKKLRALVLQRNKRQTEKKQQ